MNETKFLNWVKDLPDSFDMDVADIHFTCEDEFEGMLVEVYFDGKIRFKYEGYYDKTYFPLHSVRISHDWGEAECTTEVIVDRRDLMASLERAALIIDDKVPTPIRCHFENGQIKFDCTTKLGKIQDEISADIAGPVIEIGFKCKYLIDPLKVITDDKIKLQMSGSLLPMKIVPLNGDGYTYLVLPVRLKQK